MISYIVWRTLFIAVRPLLIFGSGINNVVGDEIQLAQAIMYAGFMMAALSCGTFKEQLQNGVKNNRQWLFFIWTSVVTLCVYILPEYVVFVVLYIFLEYVHDESRIILYSGNRCRAIKLNCLRLAPVLLLLVIPMHFQNAFLIILILMNLVVFKNTEFSLLKEFSFPRLPSFYDFKNLMSFFVHSFLSKFSSNSDRFLFSIINLENLWTYMLISQIFSSLYQYYDVRYISKIKEKIVKSNLNHKPKMNNFELLSLPFSVGIATLALLSFWGNNSGDYYIIIALFMISSPLLLIAMIQSEHYFWKNSASEVRNLEGMSLIFASIVGVFIFLSGFFILCRATVVAHSISKLVLIRQKINENR